MTTRARCKVSGCKSPPARGAWALPASGPPFPVTLLCAEHGRRAEQRGARHMRWRPSCLTAHVPASVITNIANDSERLSRQTPGAVITPDRSWVHPTQTGDAKADLIAACERAEREARA